MCPEHKKQMPRTTGIAESAAAAAETLSLINGKKMKKECFDEWQNRRPGLDGSKNLAAFLDKLLNPPLMNFLCKDLIKDFFYNIHSLSLSLFLISTFTKHFFFVLFPPENFHPRKSPLFLSYFSPSP